MKKLITYAFIQGFCGLMFIGVVHRFSGSLVCSGVAAFTLLVLVSIKPTIMIMNKLVQHTNWYKNQIMDGLKFRKQISFNLDICNLGSSSAKFAFSYEGTGLKGENWAVGPQTLSYDFRVLKNFSSYLKEGATVLIPLCPFSGCVKDYEDDLANHKYYSFLNPILILNYSQSTKEKVMKFVNTPFQSSTREAIKRLIKDVPATDDVMLSSSSMDAENLEKDADMFLDSWKREFSISDLDAAVSDQNIESITYNTNLITEMVLFCLERDLKPVVVIPPTARALSVKLSESFREFYIYPLVRFAPKLEVTFLNYLEDDRFSDNKLFLNSFFMNAVGREVFTTAVMNDLGMIL